VLWVNGCEFAIEAHDMAPGDHTWVTEFLKRKLDLSRIGRASDDEAPFPPITEISSGAASPLQTQFSVLHDLILWLLGAQPDMTPIDVEPDPQAIPKSRCREEADYRIASDRWLREVWYPALRIVRGMRARRISRAVTGKDSIANN